jgi:hypothetical protein
MEAAPMLVRRAHLILLGLGIAVAAGLFVHSAAAQPALPGRFLTWPAAATPAATSAPSLPMASPSATPAASDPLGALQVPLESMLRGLNADTAASARGQYDLLQELEQAVRDHIDSFLHWAAGR